MNTEAPPHRDESDHMPAQRCMSGLPIEMSDETFFRFSEFVTSHLGIKMPDVKKTMLQSRLQKRMRMLGLHSYEDYYRHVFGVQGRKTELPHMIDAVTTNKTDFFREPMHFQYLAETALPMLMSTERAVDQRHFRFWSAGCSTGAEPYTLAMVLSSFAEKHGAFRYTILGTDISQKVLKEAIKGVYEAQMTAPIPGEMRKKYLLRSRDPKKKVVRVVPEIRAAVQFRQLNFMDPEYGLCQRMDAAFCRNVLIYFDRPTRERVINRICRHLLPGGYLFIGHSETLNGLDVPLAQVKATIYRKRGHS